MIDLYTINLATNAAWWERSLDDRQAAEFIVYNKYIESWPQLDYLIYVGVEQDPSGVLPGEIVWKIGSRRREWGELMWSLRRMSVRLFNPWSDRPGWIPHWAMTREELSLLPGL